MTDLMKHWSAVETALGKWQNAVEISANNTTAEKLLSTLEQFNEKLENFTASLVFLQYEGMGLLSEDSGKTTCLMAQELTASVKKISETYLPDVSLLADKIALTQKADAIRQELYLWSNIDTSISSKVFSRLFNVFGIFLFFVICLVIIVLFLYRDLRHSRIQEKDSLEFAGNTILAQENERTLISVELHDTVLQDMGRWLQLNKTNAPTDQNLSELAYKIMNRTREICRSLMPPDFSRLALTDLFIQLCSDFEKRMSVECRPIIDKDFSAERLSPQMQLQIYRIVQEALSNVEKHSEAKEVTLTAQNKDEKTLLIYITDDGKGNMANLKSGSGLGIRGMNQRAAILGASLSFIEGAGSGVTVRLEVPLPPSREL
jgi:signal transduction histidine kinase